MSDENEALKAQIAELTAALEQKQEEHSKMAAKNSELLSEKKTAAQKAKEAEEAAEKLRMSQLDRDDLQKAYEERLAKELQQSAEQAGGEISALKSALKKSLIDSIASEYEDDAHELISMRINGDLDVSLGDGGKVNPIILGSDGKPSASSFDEYRESLKSNPAMARLLKGSQARGVGPINGDGGGAAKPDVSSLSPKQKMDLGRQQSNS